MDFQGSVRLDSTLALTPRTLSGRHFAHPVPSHLSQPNSPSPLQVQHGKSGLGINNSPFRIVL